VSGRDG
jgi:hypothetical protein